MEESFLTPDQKHDIEQYVENLPQQYKRRAQLLFLYNTGLTTREVAAQVGLSLSQTRYWRQQFRLRGMGIFPVLESTKPEQESSKVEITEPVSKHETIPAGLPLPQPLVSPGILPDDLMSEAGRKTMLYHFAEMLSHEAGTRLGQDPEQLHDMRVATRRLRAAFAVFEGFFFPEVLKPFLKRLRAAGRALGRVRDLDVILENALAYLEKIPIDDRPGLQPLLQYWQDERTQAREQLTTLLDSKKYSNLINRYNLFVQTPGMGAVEIKPDMPVPIRVREVAPALIYTRLEAIRAYEPILANATLAQLHALRIEFKRFRYTLEFFREVLGDQAKSIINELKGLQDHLGELHDADVTCQIIRQFLTEWDARQTALPLAERQNPQPIVNYLAYISAELHRLLICFPQAWHHFNRLEFRTNLALAVAAL